ncbi:hypothetical protein DIS24_g4800 [Lasiodiplodia hormozganensis]|uniref:AroM protein n=1 Tax=Lasiodiplodia hormozganensis TaxID=869390 RepID=A0AA40D2Z2_9PEZI|nr:hypothetical protein DIS24_g4800 [Lasiodiplodia hormozganensis]
MPPPTNHTLALITIGQSPRHDYAPDLPSLLPPRTRLVQHGALDALSLADVRAQLSPTPDEAGAGRQVLVSRMRDGTEVKMDAARLEPLIEACVRRVAAAAAAAAATAATRRKGAEGAKEEGDDDEEAVDAILLLCTGDVPAFGAELDVPVVVPQDAVRRFMEEKGEGRKGAWKLVLVSPEERQVQAARGRWEGVGGCEVLGAAAATPYGDASTGEVMKVAEWIRGLTGNEKERVLVYLDCMGYTLEHKRMVEGVVGGKVEVVVPREVVFRAVGRLFGEE